MKNLLFVCYGLGIGGIEKCLVNLLNQLDRNKYKIDVLLMNERHEFLNQIKEPVFFYSSYDYVFNTTDAINYVKKHPSRWVRYFMFRLLVKLKKNAWPTFKSINKKYDIAIAYSQNDFSPYYVIDKIKANKKIMWYHNGAYEKTDKLYQRDKYYYSKFDYIVAVSNDCRNNLLKYFEDLDKNIIVLPNLIDISNIINLANKCDECDSGFINYKGFKIVTVGRLTKEKGAELVVKVCKKLKEKKLDFCWYWVGDGNQKNYILAQIKQNDLEDNFVLLGNKINPYPYIKNCNLYVQPSYYEAYCTATMEAKILNKVVVATNVGGMNDQFTNEEDGYIVNVSSDAIFKKIYELFCNSSLINQIESNLIKHAEINDQYIGQYDNLLMN